MHLIFTIFPEHPVWQCAVRVKEGVISKTWTLEEAQNALGFGDGKSGQAIIPISGDEVNTSLRSKLSMKWDGGQMRYTGMPDWNEMENLCTEAEPPKPPKGNIYLITQNFERQNFRRAKKFVGQNCQNFGLWKVGEEEMF